MKNLEPSFKAVFELIEALDLGGRDPATVAKIDRLKVLHSRLSTVDQAGSFAQWAARIKFTLDAASLNNRAQLAQSSVARADLEALSCKLAAVVRADSFSVNAAPAVQLPSTDVEATVSLPAAVSESLRNLCSDPIEAPISAASALSVKSARRADRLQDLKYLAFGAMLTIVASLAVVGSAYTFTTKGRVSRALASEFCDRAAGAGPSLDGKP